jgi:hypothetical protein
MALLELSAHPWPNCGQASGVNPLIHKRKRQAFFGAEGGIRSAEIKKNQENGGEARLADPSRSRLFCRPSRLPGGSRHGQSGRDPRTPKV